MMIRINKNIHTAVLLAFVACLAHCQIDAATGAIWNRLTSAIANGDLKTVQTIIPLRGKRQIQIYQQSPRKNNPLQIAVLHYNAAFGPKKKRIKAIVDYLKNVAAVSQVQSKTAQQRIPTKPTSNARQKRATQVPAPKRAVQPTKQIGLQQSWTRLIRAIERNDAITVAAIVPRVIPLNAKTKRGKTPLQIAQYHNSKRVIAYLQGLTGTKKSIRPAVQPSVNKLRPTTRAQRNNKILFYEASKPYYEFTNFFGSSFVVKGKQWPTSEHYFQAHKFEGHPGIIEHIRRLGTPRAAFQAGSKNGPYGQMLRRDWEKVKNSIMDQALYYKFTQNRRLKDMLLNTGNAVLVEASPVDMYWGTGPITIVKGKYQWKGKNELGKALQRLRDRLRKEAKKKK